MLQIRKLQMQGFKSFCDRTEMHFSGSGVVAIVGPNGCGKSNISDAVSWVLGEQSAKSLRGGRMEDVIFNGTRERPPTGFAEVSMTLVSPEALAAAPEPAATAVEPEGDEAEAPLANSGWDDEPAAATAPAANGVVLTIRRRRRDLPRNRAGEIVVTRRLYRSGESEYLLNHRPCRLRDIQDLFMGTGLGPESYAIIEQGRIGQILSSKPYDRRAVIEEAAGVSKYKAKRRLTEARLEAARQNLARLNDIYEEVTRQVNSLKRQAAKAQRYQALKTEFDARQRELILARAAGLERGLAEAQARQRESRAAVAREQQVVAGEEAARSTSLQRAAALEDGLRRRGEECARLARELQQQEQQLAFHAEQQAELARRAEAREVECATAGERAGALRAELDQAQREAAATAGALAEAAAEATAAEAAARQAQQRAQQLETGLESARRAGLEAMQRAAQLGARGAQLETQAAGWERQLQHLGELIAAAERELEAAGARRGQLALAFHDLEAEHRALLARAGELAPEADGLRVQEAEERRALDAERGRLAERMARHRSLEEIVAHHGYSSEAVKRLFATARRGPIAAGVPLPGDHASAPRFQPLGVLGEFVEVEPAYEQVVEQFLREELDYVVVPTWDEAGAGIDLLRAQEQGRATFLVHPEPVAAPEPVSRLEERRALAAQPGLVPLLGEVKALNGFRQGLGRVLPKLSDAYLSNDAELARRLAMDHPDLWFLTPQGECFHHCTVTGGAGRATGPLSLKRELRQVAAAAAECQQAIAARETGLAALSARRAGVQAELESLGQQRHELEKRMLTGGQAVRQAELELRRLDAQMQQQRGESERGRAERARLLEQCEQAQRELEACRAATAAAEAQQGEMAAELNAARAAADLAGAARAAAQLRLARSEERARAAQTARERSAAQHAELARRLEQLRRELDEIVTRRGELAAAASAGEGRADELRAAGGAAEEKRLAEEEALAAARLEAGAAEAAVAAARAALERSHLEAGENDVALARLETDAAHLAELCRNDLGCELEVLRAAAAQETAAAPASLDELEAAVRDLRQRIENLGAINMMALEEYEEALQRHLFLETQRKDLFDSIADTQKAIAEIDLVSREKFAAAFEQINANFQESFRALFGGGQGFLKLSEAEPGVEPGIDLIAQPPGKKLQNALLLSGGEKAMVAMALLLAIFRFQPSPFCLLDEVDAPLDEANVGRFCDMLRQLSQSTQFLLITHNKRTMETAPTLFGVTMPQPGISRLVSVQLEEAKAAIA